MARAAAAGIGGGDDRAADDDIVGAGGDRLAGRHDPLLVAGRGPAGRMPGVTIAISRPDDFPHGGYLLRRADDAVHAGCARVGRARRHQRRGSARIAGALKVANRPSR